MWCAPGTAQRLYRPLLQRSPGTGTGSLSWSTARFRARSIGLGLALRTSVTQGGLPLPSATPTASRPRSALQRSWKAYVDLLESHPLITNSLSAGVLFGLGDFLCQGLEFALARRRAASRQPPRPGHGGQHSPATVDGAWSWDWGRSVRMAIFGMCVIGPLDTYWYRFLDSRGFRHAAKRLVGASTKARMVGAQVAMDTAIIGPVGTVLFYLSFTVIEGLWGLRPLTTDEAKERLQSHFLPTLFSDFTFWPAAQAINFFFLPPTFRVLFLSAAGIIWDAWLSYLQNTFDPNSMPAWMTLGSGPSPVDAEGGHDER